MTLMPLQHHPSHRSQRRVRLRLRRPGRDLRRPGWIVAIAALVLSAVPLVLGSALPAQAAPVSGFDPGNIISDGTFFNTSTMSAADVQNFLNSKVGACASGSTCLKDYAQATQDRPADAYCRAYSGSGWESAASIIHKVSQACGVNPQVILVMLQKEQGLITSTRPSATAYRSALGMGCPDTAACDAQYYGFGNQVYSGVRQLRVYQLSGRYTWYGPGITAQIRYHPNAACGSSPVYVQNQATAALYYYTPYQPNAASLAAGKGTGDACSSYGNRNFYTYFSEWFGSPQGFTVGGSIRDFWMANGGAGGPIGPPTSQMVWTGAGWYQQFSGADLYQQAVAGRGVAPVRGSIRTEYRAVGEMRSGLGWPVGPEYAINGGAYQDFEGGRIFAKSGVATFAIAPPMYEAHETLGNVGGTLGWPTSRAVPIPGGSVQTFEGGTIYARDDESAYVLVGDYDQIYRAQGGPTGTLGWLRTGMVPDRVGSHVAFDGGWIQKSGSTLTLVKGLIGAYYTASGGLDGPLGVVTGQEKFYSGGGWGQDFQNGTVYASEAGTFAVTAARAELARLGGVVAVGFPTEDAVVAGTAWSQRFATVTITGDTATGRTSVVRGAIKRHYDALGGASSFLGAGTGSERLEGTGVVQDFAGGRIWCGTQAIAATDSRTTALHQQAGGVNGRLGWPLTGRIAETGGFRQEFQGGSIYGSTATNGPINLVVGMVRSVFLAGGGPRTVGYPTSGEFQAGGAWKQTYERGAVYLPLDGRPGGVVSGRIWEAYVAAGAEGNPGIGIPVGQPVTTVDGATKQSFSAATFFSSTAGTYLVRGLIATIYGRHGADGGRLGLPLESERALGPGFVQRFTGGTLYVSPWAAEATWGALSAEYQRRGGPAGALGWPLGPEVTGAGEWTQRFQNGTLVLSADGTYSVR